MLAFLTFQSSATSLASGSSGLGALSKAWDEKYLSNLTGKTLRELRNLDAQENRSDLQGGTPLVFENIKADTAELVNVGMVDPGDESHLKQKTES